MKLKHKNKKSTVLVIHNKYQQLGGEDSVVFNEVEVLKKEGYIVYYKEYNNNSFSSKNPFNGFISFFQIFFNVPVFFSTVYFIKKNKVNIIHVHNFFYKVSPSIFWAGKLAGAKTIMTMHNYRLFCLNAIFYRNHATCMECVTKKSFKPGITNKCFKSSSLYSRILALSTIFHRKIGTWTYSINRFIVLNPFMKELLLGVGVSEIKITIKPNFIADSHYNNYDNRNDFYLYAGRLQEEKGIRHVIKAFQDSGKKLIIAGEGDMVPFIKENLGKNITYLGRQTQSQLAALLLKCKGLIFASFLIEGMPMTIIEAHAAGAIPIVGSSVNTERMIVDGEDGFLYNCGDHNSLNQQIMHLESHELAHLNKISFNARKKYETYYHEMSHIASIEKIYRIDE